MKDKNLSSLVELLLIKAAQLDLIKVRDTMYLRNLLYSKLVIDGPPSPAHDENISIATICKMIIKNLDKNVAAALGSNPDIIEANIINTLMPMPSIIEDKFNNLLQQSGIEAALSWFHEYNCHTNSIKLEAIRKNISWQSSTIFGNLDITINYSETERHPNDSGKRRLFEYRLTQHTNGPQCQFCIEREGFHGNSHNDSGLNHRLLEIKLENNSRFFQYLPYPQYNQQAIIINPDHEDTLVNRQLFQNFFNFVDKVPHYIIGANNNIYSSETALSIYHDHYLTGCHVFPLEKAEIKFTHQLKQFPNVRLNYLNWPVSTLQLIGNKNDLLDLSDIIVDAWSVYNDKNLDIISQTDEKQHNLVTPIMRKLDTDQYCIYILLRNNRSSGMYPEGIFRPHKNLHHIRKENIGLTEAMGLAVMPASLLAEVNELKALLLLNNKQLAITELLFAEELVKHELWLDELYTKYESCEPDTIDSILKDEIGFKFNQMLEDTGVFKNTVSGFDGVIRFLNSLG